MARTLLCTIGVLPSNPPSQQEMVDDFAANHFDHRRRASQVHKGRFYVEGLANAYSIGVVDEKLNIYGIWREPSHEDQDPGPLD